MKSSELLTLPIRLGLAPIQKLGSTARSLMSSVEVAERLQREKAEELKARDVETTIDLAIDVERRLRSGMYQDAEMQGRLQYEFDQAMCRLGRYVYDSAVSERRCTPPVVERMDV